MTTAMAYNWWQQATWAVSKATLSDSSVNGLPFGNQVVVATLANAKPSRAMVDHPLSELLDYQQLVVFWVILPREYQPEPGISPLSRRSQDRCSAPNWSTVGAKILFNLFYKYHVV